MTGLNTQRIPINHREICTYIYMYIRIMKELFTMRASLKEISPFSLLPATNSFKQRLRFIKLVY